MLAPRLFGIELAGRVIVPVRSGCRTSSVSSAHTAEVAVRSQGPLGKSGSGALPTSMPTWSVCIARHGEREDYVDRGWVSRAPDPHDPPLTSHGKRQAAALGRRLSASNALDNVGREGGGPTVTRVFTSPLTRCVQTAHEVCQALGPDVNLNVEPGLMEWSCNQWYASWAVAGTDGTWGGAKHLGSRRERLAAPVERDEAYRCVSTLLKSPAYLKMNVSDRIDLSYHPLVDLSALGITVKNPESWNNMLRRTNETMQGLVARYPGESLLVVTHGATVQGCLLSMVPGDDQIPAINYTSLTICVKEVEPAAPTGPPGEENLEWTTHLIGCTRHLVGMEDSERTVLTAGDNSDMWK